jgi:hypothetical protein
VGTSAAAGTGCEGPPQSRFLTPAATHCSRAAPCRPTNTQEQQQQKQDSMLTATAEPPATSATQQLPPQARTACMLLSLKYEPLVAALARLLSPLITTCWVKMLLRPSGTDDTVCWLQSHLSWSKPSARYARARVTSVSRAHLSGSLQGQPAGQLSVTQLEVRGQLPPLS